MAGASNMKLMRWNPVLAEMGQTWADTCKWGHGQPSGVKAPYNPLGQNLWAGMNEPLSGAVSDWYNEKKDYDYNTNTCESGKMCGHYTQVVWADTDEVGCGFAHCPNLVNAAMQNADYLVCNYGPAGNYIGEKPFQKGSACTACPSGYSECTDGLCSSEKSSSGVSGNSNKDNTDMDAGDRGTSDMEVVTFRYSYNSDEAGSAG